MYKTRILLSVAVLLIAANVCLAEQAEPLKVSFTADYFSKYIWRGQNLTNGNVFQPNVSISRWGFTGSIWGSMDWTSANDHSGEFTEFDYSLDYTAAIPWIKGINFSVGTVHYEFPGTVFHPTTEVYAGLSLGCTCNASGKCLACFCAPWVKVYRDVDEFEGTYLQFGIGRTIEKIATFGENCYAGLQLGTSFGYGDSKYNKGYFGADGGGMNDWTISAALPISFGAWTVKPSLSYSTMLDSDIRSNTAKSDNLWFGVSLSRSF